MGTYLLGGFGLWLVLNGVVAARLIRRSIRSNTNASETVVFPFRHQA